MKGVLWNHSYYVEIIGSMSEMQCVCILKNKLIVIKIKEVVYVFGNKNTFPG